MKTVAFCWELGSGNGHVGPFEPLARRFLREGWKVVLIVRDLSRVYRFFSEGDCEAYQAPFKVERAVPHLTHPATFCQMLLNLGYRHEEELLALVQGWRRLLGFLAPDVMVFDHSPTALLSTRDFSIPRFTIGHGFYIPVDQEPLADIAPWWSTPVDLRLSEERIILDRVNRVLKRTGQPELDRMGALFTERVVNCFTTFQELDHNSPRVAEYFGAINPTPQARLPGEIRWPSCPGPKVFGYLKSLPNLGDVLEILSRRNVPAIIATDNVNVTELRARCGKSVVLYDRPIQMNRIVNDCDLALTNAGHGTICPLLLAGIPQMLIPLTTEQAILSGKVKAIGAGLDARRDQPELIQKHLEFILDHSRELGGANAFKIRYRNWRQEDAVEQLFQRMFTDEEV